MSIVIVKKGVDGIFANALLRLFKNILSDLEFEYPFFLKWLYKVFEEIQISENRIILIDCNSSNSFDIRGIAILKNTFEERKICTLRQISIWIQMKPER